MGQHKRTAVNKWAAQCSQTLMLEQHRKRRGEGGKWRTGSTEDFKRQPGHSLVTLWKHSCDTLETLLWHFGYSLVTLWKRSCDTLDTLLWHPVFSRAIHMSAAIALFTLSIPTDCCSGMLFRDFHVLQKSYEQYVHMLIIITCTKNCVKQSDFCGNILHQQFSIFLCQ